MQLGISDHEGLTPLDLVIKDRLSHVNFHHTGNCIQHCLTYVLCLFTVTLVYDC